MGAIKALHTAIQELIEQHGAAAVAQALGAIHARTCKRCGNTWTPRQPGEPKQCPRCKSALWHTERGHSA